ncbi:paraquat-inducible protein A [Pseudomonas nitritireducens]|uniref:Paraquat-inducible protein A n=1 Tax=Pseudomonas nitroreducens TaxID=46680 RepID=A0A7W7P2Y1_PSENT|nr:paraquat-inducible protein A [Pseudomonas nitritireducens]MBB4864965.1 paraquat-inducible protein A [Pseudomonas nitritireducens]
MSTPPLATQLDLCLCHGCGRTCDLREDGHRCSRCGAPLHPRKQDAINRSWAFLLAALVFYVPANLLPVMHTEMLGQGIDSTIGGGVLEFWEAGEWDIALIIFIASIGVPAIKFFAMGMLLFTAQRGSGWARRQRSQLYRVVELIGYWSMLDVIVVALVAALVQMRELGTIEPRAGILFFGLVVVFTMLSAMSFDPRHIWDNPQAQGGRIDATRH